MKGENNDDGFQRGEKKPPELMMPTGGSHLSLVEEGREYPFGILPGWAVGRLRDWAEWLPRGLFLIFFSFLLFLFLFSKFFYIFCKNISNQFKPLSEIF
jgi:hypothetical protein